MNSVGMVSVHIVFQIPPQEVIKMVEFRKIWWPRPSIGIIEGSNSEGHNHQNTYDGDPKFLLLYAVLAPFCWKNVSAD
jgi:hypothetical protein